MTTHALSRSTLGIPGIAGAILLLTWLVCWAVFGMHGAVHALVPVALVLILVQAVRRVNAAGND
jgi:membrane-bound ClpP family serine protease